MLSKRRGALVALIIGSLIGGTAGATILHASAASHSTRERAETAQRQAIERSAAQVQALAGDRDRTSSTSGAAASRAGLVAPGTTIQESTLQGYVIAPASSSGT
jgi:hypothetical protein